MTEEQHNVHSWDALEPIAALMAHADLQSKHRAGPCYGSSSSSGRIALIRKAAFKQQHAHPCRRRRRRVLLGQFSMTGRSMTVTGAPGRQADGLPLSKALGCPAHHALKWQDCRQSSRLPGSRAAIEHILSPPEASATENVGVCTGARPGPTQCISQWVCV